VDHRHPSTCQPGVIIHADGQTEDCNTTSKYNKQGNPKQFTSQCVQVITEYSLLHKHLLQVATNTMTPFSILYVEWE
jgi:hypothetical protein